MNTTVKIAMTGNSIRVTGATEYAVYDMLGRKMNDLTSLERGVYVVIADGQKYKVRVK